ncbi:UTP--glucose-1-phosphate uridylyltransferase [Alicyclobacillaceae bacterium I2511]|nr:UTP--glucose-1-phosphate uridylyltransferase [Alicyclobacillaceae bacterium I2511]
MIIRKAVIPAAGFGTRMLPATKAVPKEMLPILNKPCIQYIVEEAVYAGIEEILIITGRGKKAIEDHFDRSPELELHLQQNRKEHMLTEVKAISDLVNIHYVRQKSPLGLGHAIALARSFVADEPFAVLLGDDVIQSAISVTQQMVCQYKEEMGILVGVQNVPANDVSKYGIVRFDNHNFTQDLTEKPFLVQGITEKPKLTDAPSTLAVLGRYILTPAVFDVLDQTSPGHGGEVQLTDAIDQFARAQQLFAFQFSGVRHDIGNLEGWLQANLAYALGIPSLRKVMLNQFSQDPEFMRTLLEIYAIH